MSDSLGRAVDQACNRFEQAWRAALRKEPGTDAAPPRIEDFVADLAPSGRAKAVRELVALDIEYRRRLGQQPTAEDYRPRFAELDELDELLRKPAGSGGTANSTVNFGEPDPRSLRPGQKGSYFGDYELLEKIAQGGMGIIYKARQVSLDRLVALKMIRAGEFASSAEVQRFKQEAEAAAKLDHPHIVPIFEVSEHEGQHYYAMKLIDGGSLHKDKPAWCLSPELDRSEIRRRQTKIATLLIAVARAVHHAHQRSIIHRDLKPANILIDAAGAPHVTDFGLAKKIEGDSAMTQSGAIVGTASYMSPQQANGEPITTQADIYGLGAVLYELLTGHPPFKGKTPLDTLIEVRQQEVVRPSKWVSQMDRDLETICLKCLEKQPERRYGSAETLVEDLQRWQRGEPIEARRAGGVERAMKWVRRRPAPAGLLAAGLLAPAVALITLSLLSGRLVRSAALESAAQQAELLEVANREYSRIVARVEPAGYRVNKTVPPTPGTVPLSIPATFLHDVGEQLAKTSTTGVKVRQYSDYPFPWRTDGGPRDDFERAALQRLRATIGKDAVHEFTEIDGERVVRYAEARVLQHTCVECHNSHPQSPRKDWKVGDVRGVLVIIRPLGKDEARVGEALRFALLVSGVVSGLLLGGSVLAMWAGRS
jgi:tRNA A-37 threonylcarbamoyl transferase component Bud32